MYLNAYLCHVCIKKYVRQTNDIIKICTTDDAKMRTFFEYAKFFYKKV